VTDPRRQLPSVGALLDAPSLRPLLAAAPRALVVDAVRDAVDRVRRACDPAPADDRGWSALVEAALERRLRPSLRPVLNGTGVVLHTNLGRAPLAPAALAAVREVAEGFCNLEYDLEQGRRGSRHVHCVSLLRELTGAEDALVVNNCAAALVLALDTEARGRDAVISRGELVEIGGSFRVPDIMAKSGARLLEVGTTNRTHRVDYERAVGPDTGALVKVHRSNFAIDGFTAEVGLAELADVARAHALPLLYDFGSGLLLSLERWGLAGEPTASEAVAAGATLVLMSGDKLLGGPQAGIVLGTASAVARLRANPLARALRVDKLTIAALHATLALYREPERAAREIPALAMLTSAPAVVRERAEWLCARLTAAGLDATVVETQATVGGGAFPTARIPSSGVAMRGDAPALERRARMGGLPVIGRIALDRFLVDMRSVPQAHDVALGDALTASLTGEERP
jgi:L-seryl-tRNA(Ser) seleniumtransferase